MAKPVSFRAARQKRSGKNLLSLMEHMANPAYDGWDGALLYNELSTVVEVRAPWPPVSGRPKADPEPLDEVEHVLKIQQYFQLNGMNASKHTVYDALQLKAREQRYHPVKRYFDTLQWDGRDRLKTFCIDYLGAPLPAAAVPPQPMDPRERYRAYLALVGRCLFVSAVARIYQPGCKVDHIPVLVGVRQGEQKSQALQALCPDTRWFTDNIGADATSKDTKEALVGKWIVELAEMQLLKSHPEAFKSFITTTTDRYRPAYGRVTSDYQRQCILIGTSNDLDLPDDTGNRRFWGFLVGAIDVQNIVADRDQLWAEAVHLFVQRKKWWPENAAEEALCREVQLEFAEDDTWQTVIFQWVSHQQTAFTLGELFAAIPSLTDGKTPQKRDEQRAAKCLRRLGYRRYQARAGSDRTRFWQRLP